jgi:hypothetical protein
VARRGQGRDRGSGAAGRRDGREHKDETSSVDFHAGIVRKQMSGSCQGLMIGG